MKSLFKEYLTMVGNGLKNLPNVVEGNINYYKDQFGILEEDKKQEAERRYKICLDCPFNSANAVKIGFYETQRDNAHCSVCKCPLEKKVMSFDENCGLSYIQEVKDEHGNTVSGLEGFKPMWTVYEKN